MAFPWKLLIPPAVSLLGTWLFGSAAERRARRRQRELEREYERRYREELERQERIRQEELARIGRVRQETLEEIARWQAPGYTPEQKAAFEETLAGAIAEARRRGMEEAARLAERTGQFAAGFAPRMVARVEEELGKRAIEERGRLVLREADLINQARRAQEQARLGAITGNQAMVAQAQALYNQAITQLQQTRYAPDIYPQVYAATMAQYSPLVTGLADIARVIFPEEVDETALDYYRRIYGDDLYEILRRYRRLPPGLFEEVKMG